MSVQDWEGVARDLLERAGADDPPVDAFEVAACWGFKIEPAAIATSSIDMDRRVIRLNVRARHERQQMSVAHELGHFGLVRGGLANDENGARYIGGAMLLPRAAMCRDLTRTAWSIAELRLLHPNASSTAIALRIVQIRDAVVTLIDPRGHQPEWRRHSPGITDRRVVGASCAWERDLAARAWATGEEVRGDELCYAVTIPDDAGTEDRVIVVCEIEQLAARVYGFRTQAR